ncbi:putative nepenthesin [Dioscorea sansibarensis]
MASSSSSFLASLLIFLSVFRNFNACNASSQGGLGFSMNLIHRDSPRSPHYQTSVTSEDRVRAMIDRSLSRARHISSIISGTSDMASDDDSDGYSGGGGVYTSIASSPSSSPPAPAPAPAPSNIQSKVIPNNNGDYLMELEVGTPPVKIVAIADTGSDLVWIQCRPCKQCYNQKDPIFDPSKSSTFNGSAVSCSDDICLAITTSFCNKNRCDYDYEYADGSATFGTLVKDTFTFSSDSNKTSSIPGIVFGCSDNSSGSFDANGDGLIGLGGGIPSLVSQLDSSIHGKFSYCLVPYIENTTSTLNLGDNAVVNGPGLVTIPMDRRATFYIMKLQSVVVGNDTIPNLSLDTNIIVDSGTTITFIPNSTLTKLIDGISKMVNLTRTKDPQNYFSLCYSYSANAPLYPFPDITFTFNKPPHDPASLVLTPMQAFLQVSDDVLCLAMQDKNQVGISIFGNVAQQNMHVGYDLHSNLLSFAPANCSKF